MKNRKNHYFSSLETLNKIDPFVKVIHMIYPEMKRQIYVIDSSTSMQGYCIGREL
jgi:hypothetical protein